MDNFRGEFTELTAAIILAADSGLGSDSMDITDNTIDSTVWTGDHLSEAASYPNLSSPGSCRIEIQTSPSSYTIQIHFYYNVTVVNKLD